MTPYQLKRNILYSAIQGKITAQLFTDGSGCDVLFMNKKAIERLSHEQRSKVGKGCKEISKDEVYFDIPANWSWERFGNLVVNFDSQRKPVTKSDRKTTNGTYAYYGATGEIDRVDDYLFDGEYLMIGEDGGNFFVERDNSFIANGKFWANNHVHVVQPILCEIKYLKICLDSYDLPNMGKINGIAVPKLNQENMNSILIPVPPLAEQKRIVAKIEELLLYIDRYEKAWTRLEDFNKRFPADMQKSILQLAIQGKLTEQRPEEGTGEELYRQIQKEKQALIKAGKIKKEKPLPEIADDEIPFDIPESWKWVRLMELSESIGDGIHGTPKFDSNGNYFFVNGNNLEKGKILFKGDTQRVSEEEYQRYRKPLKDTTVFISINGTIGNIAYYNDEPIILGKSACYITLFHGLYRQYLRVLLESKFFLDYAFREATQTTIKNVSLKAIRMFPIPLPPLAEQKRIVAKLEELLPLCERLK